MKTSRLAVQAIPCRDAHLRVSARPLSTGIRRFIPFGHLVKFAALLATCAIAAPLEAASVKLAWNPNPESDIAGYRLSYGTSSGSHASSVETGNVTTTTVSGLSEGQTYYFVVRAVNTSGLVSDPSQEISHTVPMSNLISRTGWRVHYVDSQEAPADAGSMAIDGDPNTFWHTAWKNGTTPPPHEIQIDLGSVQSMAGFRYLPRQDSYINGNIAGYEFYVSMDGVNWGSPVATGTFANTKAEKEVLFSSTSGRYIRLRQLSEVAGQNHCSVAELNLIMGGEVVTPEPNNAPAAYAATVTANEDSALAITLSANDPDGDALAYQIVRQPALGKLSGTAPSLTYTPNANISGGDSFTFRVSDGSLTSDTVTVAITIMPVNDAPVAASQSVNAIAGIPLPIALSATDVDGDKLSYQVTSSPSQGTLSGAVPNLSYTPNPGASGTDSFTFRTSDGWLNSNTATVSISIAPVMPGTLISRAGWRVHYVDSEEAPGDAATKAIDGDPNTFWHTAWRNGTTPPPHEIQIDLGTTQPIAGFRYLPRQGLSNNGNIANYEFYVSMDGVNWGSPVATGTFANTKAEKEVLFPSTTGRYVRLRQLSEVAGQNHCSAAELNLVQGEIAPVQPPENRAPVASSQSVTTQEDEAVSITLAASDPDGDSLTWQIVTQPSMGTLSGTAPNLTYTPHADANGSDSLTFRVIDGDLTSNTATVSITVAPVNDAPVAAASSVATAEDAAVGILLSATDKDGDTLAYRVVSQPSKGTLSGTPPNLTYTPGADYNGSDSFAFRANDGTADSATTTVSITITPVNDAPVAVARMVSTPADTPVAITLVATDKDGDPLSYRIVSQPVKGTLSGTPPNLTYTPGQGVSGSDSLSFRVNDGIVNSNTATVSITLTAPLSDNRPPVFQTTRISRSTGTAGRDYSCTSLEGCATDPDGDSVAYVKTAGPEWLTVGPDGSIAGTPPEDATGRNAFIIRASDPEGAYADALLEIQVQSTSLPQPWEMQRFGSAGDESTASGDGLSFTLTGSGALAGKSDSGLLTWQPLTEDGDITARITSLEGMGSASRIGLMIRENLLADSKHTFIGADGRGYVRWVRRTKAAGNTSISTVSLTDPLNLWLRLSREGGTITAFTSADGSSWTRVGSANIDLGASCYIGLSVSSGSTAPGTAVFDNVTVTP